MKSLVQKRPAHPHFEVEEVEEAVGDFDADAEACCNPSTEVLEA